MTDVEVLKSYRAIQLEIIAIQDQLDRAGITGCPQELGAQVYDRVGGATNDKTAASMQLQEGISQRLNEQKDELNRLVMRFDDIVNSVRDPMSRVILRRYYALGEKDEQVAFAIGWSVKSTNRARNEAVEKISVRAVQ